MIKRNIIYGIPVLFMIIALAGCGTLPKKFQEEVSGIKTKVDDLESRVGSVETKQTDVERASSEQAQAIEEMKTRKKLSRGTRVGSKPRAVKSDISEIQTALKNAGFYDGKVDGIKGKATRKAIRDFQGANGLTPDGIVGAKTWELLSKHAAAPQGPAPEARAEEGTVK